MATIKKKIDKTKNIQGPPKKNRVQARKKGSFSQSKPYKTEDFFVVCLGASAGGLQALEEFLKNLPANTGMSFVFIQHLSPKQESLLPKILSRYTDMDVQQVTDGTKLRSDTLFVIPPGTTMFLKNNSFKLLPRKEAERPHMPIDRFMESMAHELGNRSIGVILSGTGTDGAEGLKLLKAEGGLSFAQTPNTATYESMPVKAIISDDIDFVLSPKGIAQEITNLSKILKFRKIESRDTEIPQNEQADFSKILLLLKQISGTDFSHYKPSTIRRRVARRMLLHKCEKMSQYFKYLQTNPRERLDLVSDVLINVTNFFREPETFEYLKKHLIPAILKNKPQGQPLRIWSAGCATGEETYSIAICVLEVMGAEANPSTVQIFATDLSEKCIEKARIGIYMDNINKHVSDERLKKYFSKIEGGYRIGKQVRDLCIFARHDLTRDPAYSKLDLISCKNLLIYLGQELQTRVLENFHYSMNNYGFLCLGNSETIGKSSDIYSPVDSKLKIYSKKAVTLKLPPLSHAPIRNFVTLGSQAQKESNVLKPSQFEIQSETDRAILSRFSNPSVVVDPKNEILQFRGITDPFLIHKQGEATLNIFKMARDGLSNELKSCLQKARQKETSVRSEAILLTETGMVTFEIIPLKFLPGEKCHLIVFELNSGHENKIKTPGKNNNKKLIISTSSYESLQVTQLKQELSLVKDNLQAVIHDFENANQELQSANEEVLSSNEELQSTNEELETSKEELQSANEELSTVNDELQERNEEMFRLSNDIVNVLNSVQIPIIIVSNDLSIRRYTPSSTKIFNLIPTDIGRPFAHISSNHIPMKEVGNMIKEVLENAVIKEKDIHASDNKWYHLRVRPYKTDEQKIEGAVVTLQENLNANSFQKLMSEIFEMIQNPFVVLDNELNILMGNSFFYECFKLKSQAVVGSSIFDIATNFGGPKLKKMLKIMLDENKSPVLNEKIVANFGKAGKMKFNLTARRVRKDKSIKDQILVSFGYMEK